MESYSGKFRGCMRKSNMESHSRMFNILFMSTRFKCGISIILSYIIKFCAVSEFNFKINDKDPWTEFSLLLQLAACN